MNYIKELNAFREWLLSNDLSAGAISVWHTLMSINNTARWKKRFNAPNAIVRQLSGVTKQGLLDARKKLAEQGLITFEKGKRGQASIYEMMSLTQTTGTSSYQSQDESEDESVYQSNGESRDESTYQSTDKSPGESMSESKGTFQPVRKHKHKEKQERRQEDKCARPLLSLYEQNIGKLGPIVKDELEQWTTLVGEPIVTEAIKHTTKFGGRTFSYLEKILQEWREASATTLDAVRAYESQKNSNANNTVPFRRPEKEKAQSLFDELREEI